MCDPAFRVTSRFRCTVRVHEKPGCLTNAFTLKYQIGGLVLVLKNKINEATLLIVSICPCVLGVAHSPPVCSVGVYLVSDRYLERKARVICDLDCVGICGHMGAVQK